MGWVSGVLKSHIQMNHVSCQHVKIKHQQEQSTGKIFTQPFPCLCSNEGRCPGCNPHPKRFNMAGPEWNLHILKLPFPSSHKKNEGILPLPSWSLIKLLKWKLLKKESSLPTIIWYHLSGAMLDARDILQFVVKMSGYLEQDLSLNLPKISSNFVTWGHGFSNIVRYLIWMCHLQRSLKGRSLSPWVIQSFANKGHRWHHGSHHFLPHIFQGYQTKRKGFLPKFQSSLDFATWATKKKKQFLLSIILI